MSDAADDLGAPLSGSATPGLFALAALVAAVPFTVGLSSAEPPSAMSQGLLSARQAKVSPVPAAQRFTTPDGAVQFTLDRTGPAPLIRFANQPEILALHSSPGPRGDEFLKTDTGMLILRVSSLGGVTVYTGAGSAGAAASLSGESRPLAGPPAPSGGLSARLSALSSDTSRKLGRTVSFEAQSFPQAISAVAADAANLTAEALIRSENTRVDRVIIIPGASPAVHREGGVLKVTVAPPMGYAGRPSAAAIMTAAR
jgi:hypothetical protein